jgi:hypothetical protein
MVFPPPCDALSNGIYMDKFYSIGISFDILERDDNLGGNWYSGVYETVHIISSRRTTEYKDFPMPDTYPDFPSKVIHSRGSFAYGCTPLAMFDTGRYVCICEMLNNRIKCLHIFVHMQTIGN